ncbi:hypothetical protein DCAR_0831052 [Daucus carota subsp. sativus]|uniref:Aminotransferase-like plant mobile domain-containing protein n=1 Tax=Daucus carota subsp. sativus TaxID=79200 RepID=A0AAF0XP10_DAUCS|nr:hypothetical protein DCAR_0831052 [Daucus carota subsp. sativus]
MADTLVEEREEVMVPANSGNPIFRKAHFLKPMITEHNLLLSPPPNPLLFSKPCFQKLENCTLQSYKGLPSEKWKLWVQSLRPRYQETWKKAGIYHAILASTHTIPKDKMLIFGLAERWCADTNSFIFPWGEVTISLEDVVYLACHSVLGASFSTPLDDEFVDIFKCLKNDHKRVRLGHGGNVSASSWMEYFMFSGHSFEHEAFLALWLSRFVLVRPQNYIGIKDFRVAIHLSRGAKIALAPVVLACVYRDMRVLKNSIVELMRLESVVGLRFISCHYDLVQMWAWERFAGLRPAPNIIGRGEPRSLRWNGVKNSEVDDVRSALSSAELVFVWRPYVSSNSMLSNLCRDDEQWVVVDSDALESFARCLRTSELVGLGYTEQYLPHRVAMQFGLDQDIPHVVRLGGNPETGWTSYNRPLRGVKLFIPPRLFKADVTSRYVTWYRKTILLCTNETMESGMQNMWSSYKCRKSKPFTENQSGPKECAVITRNSNLTNKPVEMSSHSMSSNTRKEGKSTERQTKLEQYGEVSPEDNIANVVDESYEDTATELQHLGLEARICRLERIFDKIKAARFCASSQTDVDN